MNVAVWYLIEVLVAQSCSDYDGLTGCCHPSCVLHTDAEQRVKNVFFISMKTCTHEGDSHQNQTPSLPFTGSENAEHREQQAADLHHVHDHGRSHGHQLGRETTGKPLMGGKGENCCAVVLLARLLKRSEVRVGDRMSEGNSLSYSRTL